MGLNTNFIISGPSPFTLPSAGYSNPMYLGASGGDGGAVGFDITTAALVVIAFEGTYTGATVVHEQTLDSTGVGGWFSVLGSPNNGGSAISTGSTSGAAYLFVAEGVRHRIRVTALATGTLAARVMATTAGGASTGAGGGGGSSLIATANAASPTYSESAAVTLSTDLHGATRVLAMATDGTPLDPTLPSPVKGSIAQGSTASDPPVFVGARASTAAPTPVTDGQVVDIRADKTGRLANVPFQVRDLCSDATITITASTAAATLIGAGAAGVFNDLLSLTFSNISNTGTEVQLLNDDGTTVRWDGYVPANDMRGIVFSTPMKGAAAAATWKVKTVTSVTSMKVTAQYVSNT